MSAANFAHLGRLTVDPDHWRITKYGQNNKTNLKYSGATQSAPAACSSIRSRYTAPYFLSPRARPALHCQVGQTFDSLAPGSVF